MRQAASLSILILLACGLAAERAAADGHLAANSTPLEGTWKLVRLESRQPSGNYLYPADQAVGEMLVVSSTIRMKLQISGQVKDYQYTFRENLAANPRTVDYFMPDKSIIKGIYTLEGDTLTRCNAQPNEEGPTDFNQGMFSIWRRVK